MASARSAAQLADPALYQHELQRLGDRAAHRGGRDALRQWDASLGELWGEREALCRRLARSVVTGEYRLGPARASALVVGGKRRTLQRFAWIDHVVVAVLARALSSLAERELPDGLHSYRRGRSAVTAIASFSAYLQKHRKHRPLQQRGLYVLRRDVAAYGESIHTHADSALWSSLQALTQQLPQGEGAAALGLLRQALRPQVHEIDGRCWSMVRGTPTGSPLQPLVNNLYLSEVDRELSAIDGAFYARFGDDMLWAHPDAAVAQQVARRLSQSLAQLGLSLSDTKRGDLYLTHCGRPSGRWPRARGSSSVDYLGFRIALDGTVGLKRPRVRALLADLRRRWSNALMASDQLALNERRQLLCTLTSQVLDPRAALHCAATPQLLAVVTDRAQLRQLDYTMALELAQRLAGRRGVRAFRDVPYRSLRAAGLASLVVARNRHRARKAGGAP